MRWTSASKTCDTKSLSEEGTFTEMVVWICLYVFCLLSWYFFKYFPVYDIWCSCVTTYFLGLNSTVCLTYKQTKEMTDICVRINERNAKLSGIFWWWTEISRQKDVMLKSWYWMYFLWVLRFFGSEYQISQKENWLLDPDRAKILRPKRCIAGHFLLVQRLSIWLKIWMLKT